MPSSSRYLDRAQQKLRKVKNFVLMSAQNRDNRYVEEVEEEQAEKETSFEKDPNKNNEAVAAIDTSNMTEEAKKSIKEFVKDMSKAPAGKQLGVGAVAGWISGYIAMKVGKAAATAIGGSLIFLQIAHYKGYVKINWNQLTNDSQTIAEQVRGKLSRDTKTGVQKLQEFASQNVYLASGYAGGFLIGMASS